MVYSLSKGGRSLIRGRQPFVITIKYQKEEENKMLYSRFTLAAIEMITGPQDIDLEHSFVCKSETSNRSVRHVS